MLAADLINNELPVLKPGDSVERALQLMTDFRYDQLVYADGQTYLGIFTEDILLNFDYEEKLDAILPLYQDKFVYGHQHIYEIIGSLVEENVSFMAVLDNESHFQGVINTSEVTRSFITELGFGEQGSVIEINLKNRDYSLTEISRLVESEKIKIIGSYLTGSTYDLDNNLKLTLKLNRKDISSLLSTLNRFGFEVESYHTSEPVDSLEKDRYDMLMKYLSI